MVNQGNLSCLVSDTLRGHYPLWREHIITHQKPIEEVMKYYDVLPFSFSNIANTEDQIKEKLLKERKDELENLFQKFKGRVEVGLKAFWPDMQVIFQEIAKKSRTSTIKKGITSFDLSAADSCGRTGRKIVREKKERRSRKYNQCR